MTLHVLSHAWTHQNLDDADREAFLELRNLHYWDEPARWFAMGAEHAAEIMAWGLLDADVGVLTVAPNDQQSLVDAFRFLTSVDPICELPA